MTPRRVFIEEFRPGETVDQVFFVREKDLRTTRTGDLYITATLTDRTGSVSARMWQASESIFQGIPAEGFLHVKGRTEEYRGTLQLVIDACRPWSREKVDLADFLPVTERDIEEMWAELLEILRGIRDEHLRLLIRRFVTDRRMVEAFKKSPAAMQMHHAFIGGLLEHTLNVLRACKVVLPLYPELNADLVLAGVFLHDAGKTVELTTGTATTYTDRGQLVGHITIAAIWIEQRAREVAEETGEPFPQRLIDLLQHLILSHHGVHEYGSPKLPAIPEAYFVHYLDNLDAKMFMTLNAIAKDPDATSSFTPFLRELGTRVYKYHAAAPEDDEEEEGPLFE